MGKVMRHTLGASLNIRHNLSSSKGPKPLQLKLLTTYIPKTSAFTLAFSTSQRLRDRKSVEFCRKLAAERPLKDIRDEYNYPKKKGIKDECSRLLEASTMKSRRGFAIQ